MEVGACVGAGGRGGDAKGEGRHLLFACVGECCECRVEGGGWRTCCYSRLPVNNA